MSGVRDNLGDAFWKVLEFLAANAVTMRFGDPANINNEADVAIGQRFGLASAAQIALQATN